MTPSNDAQLAFLKKWIAGDADVRISLSSLLSFY